MQSVKKADFVEAMNFLRPALRELSKLAVPHKVDENKMKITIQIPKYVSVKYDDPIKRHSKKRNAVAR